MALKKTIPVITLACLMIAQPANAFSLPDSVQVKLDEAQSIIEAGYGKACDATKNVADRVKRNKGTVLAVTALSVVAAYCIHEGIYTTRQAIPGEPSTNDQFTNNKKAKRFAKAFPRIAALFGIKNKENAKVDALVNAAEAVVTPVVEQAVEAAAQAQEIASVTETVVPVVEEAVEAAA